MTKVRPPVSIEATLMLVLAELTLDVAAELTGRAPGYLHALTDPSKRELLSVRDMITLDAAHHARFGRGRQLFRTAGLLLEQTPAFADAEVLHRHVAEVAREGGEATAALAEAALAAGDPVRLERALHELEQADAATEAAIVSVRTVLGHARDGPPEQPP